MKHTKLVRLHHIWGAVWIVCFILRAVPALLAQNAAGVANTVSEEPGSVVTTPEQVTASGNVSIDFKDADINNVLRILSLKSQVNIVAGPEVQGTITIRLEDVPWQKALDVVLRTYGYVYEREGNIIRVTTKENLSTEELMTETFVLNYTTAAEAEEAIKEILSERGRIKSVSRTNMLVVTDIPTNLYKIREVIAKLDRNTPQAHIDSKIVETQLQEGENLGINWTPAGTVVGAQRPTTLPFTAERRSEDRDFFESFFGRFYPRTATTGDVVHAFDPSGFPIVAADTAASGTNVFTLGRLDFTSFQAVLEFLRTRENTKVISNPRITVLNNQKAKCKGGSGCPLPAVERNETSGSCEITGYEFRETGVVMEVTPHINDADEILVDLKPEISASSGSTSFSSANSTEVGTSIPNFTVTTAETQVLIKNGQTIAIGGLMTDSAVSTERKVPVLGDIPLVGKLFRSKRSTQGTANQKEETLFFITVTIVDTEGEPTQVTVPVRGNLPIGQSASSEPPATITAQAGDVERNS